MGIIRRQGSKRAIANYIAIMIGAVNIMIIYPYMLKEEELGIIKFVTSVAMAVVPFAHLGSASLVIRFFPYFRDKKNGNNGFLGFLVGLTVVGNLLIIILALLFKDEILAFYSDKSPLYLKYLPFAIPLIFLISLSELISRYVSNFKRIVVPFILTNVFIKIALPLLVILFFYKIIVLKGIFTGFVMSWGLVIVGLLLYLKLLNGTDFKINWAAYTKDLNKEMLVYGLYGIIGTFGGVLISQIDLIMVGSMGNLKSVSIYAIAAFMAGVMDVPRRSIESIANPIMAQASKDGDTKTIDSLYKKTAINQFIIGLYLFLGIWASIDDLFAVMPNGYKYADGKYVVAILGVAILVDLATGINNYIIGYSKYFRYNTFLVLLLSGLNVFFNWWLIPIYWIYGAALATLFSKTIYNVLKTTITWVKLRMHPFSKGSLQVLVIGIIIFAAMSFFPVLDVHPLIRIFIKGSLISLVYWALILKLRISEDISNFAGNRLKKWLK